MVIDHSRHAFHGADVTESLPVRPVSMHILLRTIVRRSSNLCVPSGETAFHVGSAQRTDVATPLQHQPVVPSLPAVPVS